MEPAPDQGNRNSASTPSSKLRKFLHGTFAVLAFLFSLFCVMSLYSLYQEPGLKTVVSLLNSLIVAYASVKAYGALKTSAKAATGFSVVFFVVGFFGTTIYRLLFVDGAPDSTELTNLVLFLLPTTLVLYCANLENRYGAGGAIAPGPFAVKQGANELDGIGGWLWLVVFSLIASPIKLGILLTQDQLPVFMNGTWRLLTSPGSDAYHPLWGPVILMEVGTTLLLIALPAITLWFLFMKSKHTPQLAATWLGTAVIIAASGLLLSRQIPAIAAEPIDSESWGNLARTSLGALIWIPYFKHSKRVKATFTSAWPKRR